MRRFFFVGPSLPDAADRVDGRSVVVRPPVAAGDLLDGGFKAGDIVGIVDGYFHQARAIPHKEIMYVLSQGVRVLGAASMGALRAAELGPWGMRGVGDIFTAYRNGHLIADDEVALRHGPAEDGYVALSDPLVNIRATLAAAVAAGRCREDEAEAIARSLASRPYRDRSLRRLAGHAIAVGFGSDAARGLAEYCMANPVDVKRRDAELLLVELVAAPTEPVGDRPLTGERLLDLAPHRTIYLREWQLEASVDLRAMRVCQVLACNYPQLHRATVLDALCRECRRDCHERVPDPVLHGAHRGWFAAAPDRSGSTFLRRWTTSAEWDQLNLTELLTRFIVRSYRIKPGIADTETALAAFRAHPEYGRAIKLGSRIDEVNAMGRAHRAGFDPALIAADQILDWLANRWSWPGEDLELAAFDRGFTSLPELVEAARPVFLAAQCDPTTREFALDGGDGADMIAR